MSKKVLDTTKAKTYYKIISNRKKKGTDMPIHIPVQYADQPQVITVETECNHIGGTHQDEAIYNTLEGGHDVEHTQIIEVCDVCDETLRVISESAI